MVWKDNSDWKTPHRIDERPADALSYSSAYHRGRRVPSNRWWTLHQGRNRPDDTPSQAVTPEAGRWGRSWHPQTTQQSGCLSSLNTGSLVLGGTHYLNSYILPPVLTAFQKQYPGVHLGLVEASSNELIEMLCENKIDLTFNCIPNPKDNFRRTGWRCSMLAALDKELARLWKSCRIGKPDKCTASPAAWEFLLNINFIYAFINSINLIITRIGGNVKSQREYTMSKGEETWGRGEGTVQEGPCRAAMGGLQAMGCKCHLRCAKRQQYIPGVELYAAQLYRADQLYRHPRYAIG